MATQAPERITEADVQAALTAPPIVNPSDPSFPRIVAAATRELDRRLEEEPESLPGTFIIKLVLDGQKALAAGVGREDAEETDLLVAAEGLPPDAAVAMLEAAAKSMQRKAGSYLVAAKKLKGAL